MEAISVPFPFPKWIHTPLKLELCPSSLFLMHRNYLSLICLDLHNFLGTDFGLIKVLIPRLLNQVEDGM